MFVFELRASWTDLVKPPIYLQDPELFTLPGGLKAVLDQFGQGGEGQWEVVLAASVIATIPNAGHLQHRPALFRAAHIDDRPDRMTPGPVMQRGISRY